MRWLGFQEIAVRVFYAGRGTNALDCGDPPQAGQSFGRKRPHHFPVPLEFIDLGDELQDLWGDGDILDPAVLNIHVYPFFPDCDPKAISIYTRSQP